MAVLTRDEILKNMEAGHIKIDPFDQKMVGPASIDLRIDNQFRVFRKLNSVVEVNENTRYQDYTDLIEVEEAFLFYPAKWFWVLPRKQLA